MSWVEAERTNSLVMLALVQKDSSVNLKLLASYRYWFILTQTRTTHHAQCLQIGESKTGWNVCEIVRATYDLFRDSPSRRENYMSCGDGSSHMMPLKCFS
ncbi:hypothetical protein DPMN_109103 [Dreissena polymorpha]|uniref:Uncharacterized protein n=1 Tax=Dreissena polymorpha TaxID=45954 RepID=A0A9D4QMM1_DREPO|nr:hypothetical protein DPMN_109103 [Dreissena polymorpha]